MITFFIIIGLFFLALIIFPAFMVWVVGGVLIALVGMVIDMLFESKVDKIRKKCVKIDEE